jgi:hypothetical protein
MLPVLLMQPLDDEPAAVTGPPTMSGGSGVALRGSLASSVGVSAAGASTTAAGSGAGGCAPPVRTALGMLAAVHTGQHPMTHSPATPDAAAAAVAAAAAAATAAASAAASAAAAAAAASAAFLSRTPSYPPWMFASAAGAPAVPEGARDLLAGLLHPDPERRLGVGDALANPWLLSASAVSRAAVEARPGGSGTRRSRRRRSEGARA